MATTAMISAKRPAQMAFAPELIEELEKSTALADDLAKGHTEASAYSDGGAVLCGMVVGFLNAQDVSAAHPSGVFGTVDIILSRYLVDHQIDKETGRVYHTDDGRHHCEFNLYRADFASLTKDQKEWLKNKKKEVRELAKKKRRGEAAAAAPAPGTTGALTAAGGAPASDAPLGMIIPTAEDRKEVFFHVRLTGGTVQRFTLMKPVLQKVTTGYWVRMIGVKPHLYNGTLSWNVTRIAPSHTAHYHTAYNFWSSIPRHLQVVWRKFTIRKIDQVQAQAASAAQGRAMLATSGAMVPSSSSSSSALVPALANSAAQYHQDANSNNNSYNKYERQVSLPSGMPEAPIRFTEEAQDRWDQQQLADRTYVIDVSPYKSHTEQDAQAGIVIKRIDFGKEWILTQPAKDGQPASSKHKMSATILCTQWHDFNKVATFTLSLTFLQKTLMYFGISDPVLWSQVAPIWVPKMAFAVKAFIDMDSTQRNPPADSRSQFNIALMTTSETFVRSCPSPVFHNYAKFLREKAWPVTWEWVEKVCFGGKTALTNPFQNTNPLASESHVGGKILNLHETEGDIRSLRHTSEPYVMPAVQLSEEQEETLAQWRAEARTHSDPHFLAKKLSFELTPPSKGSPPREFNIAHNTPMVVMAVSQSADDTPEMPEAVYDADVEMAAIAAAMEVENMAAAQVEKPAAAPAPAPAPAHAPAPSRAAPPQPRKFDTILPVITSKPVEEEEEDEAVLEEEDDTLPAAQPAHEEEEVEEEETPQPPPRAQSVAARNKKRLAQLVESDPEEAGSPNEDGVIELPRTPPHARKAPASKAAGARTAKAGAGAASSPRKTGKSKREAPQY